MAGSIAFVTPTSAPAWQRWLVFSPVARIVIFTALAFGIGYGVHDLVAHLGWTAKGASALQHALAQVSIEVIASAGAYLILVRGVERRRVAELSPRAILTYGLRGLIGGVVLFSVIVGLLWLFGCYHVHGINAHVDWLLPLLVAGISAGIGEEIITRGVLFRIVEEGLGTWWALAISALFFGAAHVFNPNATLWSSLAIAIEAGILLALVFLVTRSLWACIGLHAAWNFMQGTVYGLPVSGLDEKGWLMSTRTGPDWLSGGVFGAEASVVALGTCSVVSLALLLIAMRRRSIVRPFWARRAGSSE